MTPIEIVEQIMSQHWDMAACRCWVCLAGREAGCRSREHQYRNWRDRFGLVTVGRSPRPQQPQGAHIPEPEPDREQRFPQNKPIPVAYPPDKRTLFLQLQSLCALYGVSIVEWTSQSSDFTLHAYAFDVGTSRKPEARHEFASLLVARGLHQLHQLSQGAHIPELEPDREQRFTATENMIENPVINPRNFPDHLL